MRSCPASLGFACPLEGFGLNYSYGRKVGNRDEKITCNFPGVPWANVNGARRLMVDILAVFGLGLLVMIMELVI